jgi:hypothetical protein
LNPCRGLFLFALNATAPGAAAVLNACIPCNGILFRYLLRVMLSPGLMDVNTLKKLFVLVYDLGNL